MIHQLRAIASAFTGLEPKLMVHFLWLAYEKGRILNPTKRSDVEP